MKNFLLPLVLILSACASKPVVTYPVQVPDKGLSLEKALQQSPDETTNYLKTELGPTPPYDLSKVADAWQILPSSLKAPRSQPLKKEKSLVQNFIRQYRQWSALKRATTANQLLRNFQCEMAPQTQAMGFTLEIDFPDTQAMEQSRLLHEKVLSCDNVAKNESYFRLAIFSIQRKDCDSAMSYLKDFPESETAAVADRLAYVKSFCIGMAEVSQHNPWSGYGILLKESKKELPAAAWYLTVKSQSEEWDRLLATLVDLNTKGQRAVVQYIASKLNFEQLRQQPHTFQASVMVMMSYAGADLAVFQTLHRYISEHPNMVSPHLTSLLFPKRYWDEIVSNSQEMDPILVKALIRQESAFNPHARSRAHASGLMQLIYPTAKRFGVSQPQALLNPNQNIHAGAQFLAKLVEEFGSVELALAAYNAGPAVVKQWQKRYPTDNIDLFVEMIPYSETREYVRLVRRNFRVYESLLPRPQLLGGAKEPHRAPASQKLDP